MDTLREHDYAKPKEDNTDETSMETTTPVANADDIIVNVTQLDKTLDTFECLLLELLKAHSRERQGVCDGDVQIAPESLDTLSSEQIDRIVTSSLDNHQALQNVLKIKQGESLLAPMPERFDSVGVVSEVPGHSPSSINNGGGTQIDLQSSLNSSSGSSTVSSFFPDKASSPSESSSSNITSVSNRPSEQTSSGGGVTGGGAAAISVSSPGAKSPSISIKISPEQLKTLQGQLAEMFKQQNLQLPEGLSAEQKQLVLNSLIAQQLNASLQQLLPGGSNIVSPRPSNTANMINSSRQGGGNVAAPSPTTDTGALISSSSISSLSTVPTNTTASVSSGATPSTNSNALNSISNLALTSDRTKKTAEHKTGEPTKKKKDPDSKRPPTAFNLFFSEMYPIVQEQQPNISFADASKMVSGLWSGLGQEGKKKYYEKCEQIRNEFNSRVKETTPTDEAPKPIATNPIPITQSDQNNSSTMAMTKSTPGIKTTAKKNVNKIATREKVEGMCLLDGCYNMAVPDEYRGSKYCSNECVVNHSKILFHSWITQRRSRT